MKGLNKIKKANELAILRVVLLEDWMFDVTVEQVAESPNLLSWVLAKLWFDGGAGGKAVGLKSNFFVLLHLDWIKQKSH